MPRNTKQKQSRNLSRSRRLDDTESSRGAAELASDYAKAKAVEKSKSNAQVNKLAAKYGFPPDFDLVLRSSGAIYVLRSIGDFQRLQTFMASAKTQLRELSRQAPLLHKALAEMDPHTAEVLGITDSIVQREFIRRLRHDVEHLGDVAEAALAATKSASPGRPSVPECHPS